MDKDKVLTLARLARVDIEENEAEKISHEFEGILSYVGEVKKATENHTAHSTPAFALKNVMREDNNPHESGIYTEAILKEAPSREGDYLKVKKIL